jgi:hypothetical protein
MTKQKLGMCKGRGNWHVMGKDFFGTLRKGWGGQAILGILFLNLTSTGSIIIAQPFIGSIIVLCVKNKVKLSQQVTLPIFIAHFTFLPNISFECILENKYPYLVSSIVSSLNTFWACIHVF